MKKHFAHVFCCASIVGAGAGLAGCAANDSGSTATACQPLSASSPTNTLPTWTGSVITIAMENKSQSDIVGNPDAPYINSLIKQNALAAGYHDAFEHPSEPNYIWMAAGENFDVLDDDDDALGVTRRHHSLRGYVTMR